MLFSFRLREASSPVSGGMVAERTTCALSWGASNAALLLPGLTRRLGLPASEQSWPGAFARISLAALACGAAAFVTERALDEVVGRFLALAAAMTVGGGVYLGVAAAVRTVWSARHNASHDGGYRGCVPSRNFRHALSRRRSVRQLQSRALGAESGRV